MTDNTLPTTWFVEAADMDTPSDRLAELARYSNLQPLIAANPATSANVLTQLSTADEPAIRRAVVQNPNTPVPVLATLVAEFPREFLSNPIIPILNMTQPGFIKELPLVSWASLLRFSDLPPAWFQQIKNDYAYQRAHPDTWKLIQLHVGNPATKASSAGNVRLTYQKALPQPAALSAEEDVELFLLFTLLFPYIAPMLKKQWAEAARLSPHQIGIALSMNKVLGHKTLTLLMRQQNTFLLSQVARHPATRPRTLKWLATYKQEAWALTQEQPVVQCAVASNPHTPRGTIYRLVSASQARLRRMAVDHPSLETLDHEIIALDEDHSVRAALATMPKLELNLFTQLSSDPEPAVRAALARNLKAPLEILSALARDSEPAVRAAAAGNPRLPVEIQALLLTDPDGSVRACLSGNARLRAEHATQLAHDPSVTVRKYLAANPRTPVALLETLWQTGDPEIWEGLARHPKAAPELLTQLAHQGNMRTRAAVASHTRAPAEILAALAQENTREIWYALTSNPHSPLAILEQAVNTSSVDLWYRLVNHPAIIRDKRRPLLKLLAAKLQPLIARNRVPDWLRRAFLQYYTALPLDILALFAASPYWQERYLVARHSRMPEALLKMLAQDGICHVQVAAREALEQRQHAGQAPRNYGKR